MYSRLATQLFVVLLGGGMGACLQAQSTCIQDCWPVVVEASVPRNVQAFESALIVPMPPAQYNEEAVVFLNHGLFGGDPKLAYSLLQAVLQWGNNGEFGGQGWILSCWMEEKAAMAGSKPSLAVGNSVLVLPGDTVHFSVRRDSTEVQTAAGPYWAAFWECAAKTTSGAAVLTSVGDFDPRLDRAHLGLEAVGSDRTCANFPTDSAAVFTDLRLQLGSGATSIPDWQEPEVKNDPAGCGFGATIDGSTVRITY